MYYVSAMWLSIKSGKNQQSNLEIKILLFSRAII